MRQQPEGAAAVAALFGDKASFELPEAEQREVFNALFFREGNFSFHRQAALGRIQAQLREVLRQPTRRIGIVYVGGPSVGQRIDMIGKIPVGRRHRVEIQVEIRDRGSQQATIGREDVAAVCFDLVILDVVILAQSTPVLPLDNGDLDRAVHDDHCSRQDEAEQQEIDPIEDFVFNVHPGTTFCPQ